MRIQYAVSVVLFLATVAVSAVAQDKTIDDFTTGPYQSPTFKTGTKHSSTQTGSMIGGTRGTNMSICAKALCPSQNPYNQGSSYGYFPANTNRPAANGAVQRSYRSGVVGPSLLKPLRQQH